MVKIMENENLQLVKPVSIERNVPEDKNRTILLNIAIIGIFTALETIMTATVAIPIPASSGYFNIGEGIIYFVSILFGPFIGAFVGGVGAAFADILGGYAIFAPGTFIAKGAEGFVVGLLFKKLKENNSINNNWKIFSLILGLVAGGLMALLADGTISIMILGGILTLIIWILGFTVQKNIGVKILSIMAGGTVMVLGYFLYESLLVNLISPGEYLDPLNAALVEVPFNILQVLSGILIAIPLIAALEPVAKNYYK